MLVFANAAQNTKQSKSIEENAEQNHATNASSIMDSSASDEKRLKLSLVDATPRRRHKKHVTDSSENLSWLIDRNTDDVSAVKSPRPMTPFKGTPRAGSSNDTSTVNKTPSQARKVPLMSSLTELPADERAHTINDSNGAQRNHINQVRKSNRASVSHNSNSIDRDNFSPSANGAVTSPDKVRKLSAIKELSSDATAAAAIAEKSGTQQHVTSPHDQGHSCSGDVLILDCSPDEDQQQPQREQSRDVAKSSRLLKAREKFNTGLKRQKSGSTLAERNKRYLHERHTDSAKSQRNSNSSTHDADARPLSGATSSSLAESKQQRHTPSLPGRSFRSA